MDIAEIDKNFKVDIDIPEKDVEWFNAAEEPFTLYGGFVDEKGFYRIPREIAAKVSEGVNFLNTYTAGEVYDYILNFPLYNDVTALHIGIKKGCVLEKGGEYSNKSPVVFYGSSITQGGCVSRPGNCYQNFLSRALDMDYINLGFYKIAQGILPILKDVL